MQAKSKQQTRLWLKSIAAVLWGLVLSISLMLNMNYVSPFSADVNLLVGTLLAFTLWGVVMTYCYSCNTFWQANKGCLRVFIISALANAYFMLVW